MKDAITVCFFYLNQVNVFDSDVLELKKLYLLFEIIEMAISFPFQNGKMFSISNDSEEFHGTP